MARIDTELAHLACTAFRVGLLATATPPKGNGIGKVGTFTEMSLIRHKLGKSRNQIGVRDLLGWRVWRGNPEVAAEI